MTDSDQSELNSVLVLSSLQESPSVVSFGDDEQSSSSTSSALQGQSLAPHMLVPIIMPDNDGASTSDREPVSTEPRAMTAGSIFKFYYKIYKKFLTVIFIRISFQPNLYKTEIFI